MGESDTYCTQALRYMHLRRTTVKTVQVNLRNVIKQMGYSVSDLEHIRLVQSPSPARLYVEFEVKDADVDQTYEYVTPFMPEEPVYVDTDPRKKNATPEILEELEVEDSKPYKERKSLYRPPGKR